MSKRWISGQWEVNTREVPSELCCSFFPWSNHFEPKDRSCVWRWQSLPPALNHLPGAYYTKIRIIFPPVWATVFWALCHSSLANTLHLLQRRKSSFVRNAFLFRLTLKRKCSSVAFHWVTCRHYNKSGAVFTWLSPLLSHLLVLKPEA